MEIKNSYAYEYNKVSKISIICPSPKGKAIAKRLQECLNAKLYIKENEIYEEDFNLKDVTEEAMKSSKGIVFISSIGIAVRAIAPFLKGKDKDPGVVVVDLSCKYAVNILSGHIGGGNELTLAVSKILDTMPIITTASDNLGFIAPDILAKENDLIIEDLKKAKYMTSLLIDNKIIGIKDDYDLVKIFKGYEKVTKLNENCIWVTHNLKYNNSLEEDKLDYSKVLRLIKKDIVLGIGCRKGTSFEKIKGFIYSSLEKYNYDVRAVALVASIDVKGNEEGIIKLCEVLKCPFKTFSKEEIMTVQDKYEKSEFVLKTLGVTGVCEPSVDLAGAEITVSKIKHQGITLAIGVIKA